MDGSRFDDLARTLARGGFTRRRFLKGAVGGLVAGAAGAAAVLPDPDVADAACNPLGRTCLVGGQCCSGTCVLVGLPPLRLLQCACPPGSEACQGTCKRDADYQSDPQHCGGCGVACDVAAGEVCAAGACVCPPGTRRCDGGCTPIDEQNCAACGVPCPAGGICTVEGTTGRCACPPDTTECFRECRSTICPPGQVFDRSLCRCCGVLDGQACPSACTVPTNPHAAEPCDECCSGLCSGRGVCCRSAGRGCPSDCVPNGVAGDCPGCCFGMCGLDGICD